MAKNPILKLLKDKRELRDRLIHEVRVLEEAVMIYESEPAEHGEPSRRPGRPKGSGGIQANSVVGQAIRLLQATGTPMHVDEIVASLRSVGVEAQKVSLVSSLAKLEKLKRFVARAEKRGTFVALPTEPAPESTTEAEVVH